MEAPTQATASSHRLDASTRPRRLPTSGPRQRSSALGRLSLGSFSSCAGGGRVGLLARALPRAARLARAAQRSAPHRRLALPCCRRTAHRPRTQARDTLGAARFAVTPRGRRREEAAGEWQLDLSRVRRRLISTSGGLALRCCRARCRARCRAHRRCRRSHLVRGGTVARVRRHCGAGHIRAGGAAPSHLRRVPDHLHLFRMQSTRCHRGVRTIHCERRA